MQGSVHRKKAEVDLWEIVTPERKTTPKNGKNGTRRQENTRSTAPVRSANRKSLQIIGQDEDEQPRRQNRPAQPVRQNRASQSVRQNKSVQLIGESRTSQSVRTERPAQPIGRSGASQSVRTGRSAQPIDRSRTSQAVRTERPAQPVSRSRVSQSVRQSRPPQSVRYGRVSQPVGRERSPQAIKRRRARKRRAYLYRGMAFCMIAFCAVVVFMLVGLAYQSVQEWRKREIIPVTKTPVAEKTEEVGIVPPEITTSYLEINDYSRPGTKLDEVNSIFVHYTANPKTSAAQNRSYFANLAQTHERSASAHFIIGYEGEIIQCIPLEEQAYAVMTRNADSISIECCYLEKDGEFTQATYDSLVHLLAWLLEEYDLETSDILRHYDCGGKRCPLYFVEHEDAWEKLLADVGVYLEENGAE